MADCLAFGLAEPEISFEATPIHAPTIIAAIEFLGAASSQAKFDQLIVRLGLNDEIQLASPKSVTAKSAVLAQAVSTTAHSGYISHLSLAGLSVPSKQREVSLEMNHLSRWVPEAGLMY